MREPSVQSHVLSSLRATGKSGGLKGLEDIKALHLEHVQFSTDNDLMTPSFKLRRQPLQKHYQKQIDAMYAAVKAQGAAK